MANPGMSLTVPPTATVCYTAGLLDGEGSIQINPSKGGGGKRYWTLSVQISGNGESFLSGVREEWGFVGSLTYWRPRGAKLDRVSCNWRMYSLAAGEFLACVLPHLRLKRPQAEIALEFRKWTGSGRGSLTEAMSAQRTLLATQMRELNARYGKSTADPDRAIGVL